MLGATDPREVFARAFDAVGQFTRFPAIALFELNARANRLDLVHATGFDERTLHAGAHLPVDGSLTGVAVGRRETILSPNVSRDARTEPVAREELAREDTARIPIADHGIGVSPQDAMRIFERFERAAPSQHYGGLGLGLYVAREIVQAHGGSLLVSSQPGAGATFTVVLPIRAADHRAVDQSVAASPAPASPPSVTVK